MSCYTMRCSTENYNTQEWWKLTFELEDICLFTFLFVVDCLLCYIIIELIMALNTKLSTILGINFAGMSHI